MTWIYPSFPNGIATSGPPSPSFLAPSPPPSVTSLTRRSSEGASPHPPPRDNPRRPPTSPDGGAARVPSSPRRRPNPDAPDPRSSFPPSSCLCTCTEAASAHDLPPPKHSRPTTPISCLVGTGTQEFRHKEEA